MNAFATGAVRLWTRVYTWRLDADVRSRRVCEIESDLWEARHDTPPLTAWQQLLRLARGMPDDLSWRWEERWESESLPRPVTIAATGVVAGALIAALTYWVIMPPARTEAHESAYESARVAAATARGQDGDQARFRIELYSSVAVRMPSTSTSGVSVPANSA